MNEDDTSLDSKWTVDRGRVLMNGTQAIARVLLAQRQLDERAGWRTAGYVTGYRGSPMGGVDAQLWSIGERLEQACIRFQPAVNEDLAATMIRGTQQLGSVPDPLVDGVFAAWYGKGPGVDRAGDALKHGNFAGAHPKGGVVLFYGDDHGGKSSTVAHHSEQAVAASYIPSLYPSDPGEIVEYGLMAFAMSRYSGAWTALKCVNEIVDQTLTFDIDISGFRPVNPLWSNLPPEGVHARNGPFNPLRDEEIAAEHRLPMIQAFVRANRIDRLEIIAQKPTLAIVTAGKSYADVRAALALLDLDTAAAAARGISLFKVGCIWPLDPVGLAEATAGHVTLLVVEEKAPFLEPQIASLLVNRTEAPRLVGKRDEAGEPLLALSRPLEPLDIALAIAGRLERLAPLGPDLETRRDMLVARAAASRPSAPTLTRSPFFCSGCPHSRSTKVPEGSLSMTGIGCHTMANFARPAEALPPTHMGGEGANWIGLAPYTATRHIFQNMGDGTYYHSGLLAIRAAVAARTNITYKILYNDAVAMTGGQPVDGPISVAEIAQQVRHEGVGTIYVVSDDPARYKGDTDLPADVRIASREQLDAVQRLLRETPGCTVLIYEQTCAAEKRRRRKRGRYPDPSKRLFIADGVCEGCGDCSVQSSCVSLLPKETVLGRKRQIDQASCNKDYSCVEGFCPAFVTIEGAEPRRPKIVKNFASLSLPPPPAPDRANANILIAGIGGTGVVTVGAILSMAAHIEGRAASAFDMTGLAQKNGAVYSHLRLASSPRDLATPVLGRAETDLLLAFDLVAALAPDALATLRVGESFAIASNQVAPTSAFQFDRDLVIDRPDMTGRLSAAVGEGRLYSIDAAGLAAHHLGDAVAANMCLVGMAVQMGQLPLGLDAIERAIRLNGAAVELNLAALHLGRLAVLEPSRLSPEPTTRPAATLDELVEDRSRRLVDYQDRHYAARYRALVERVRAAEHSIAPYGDELSRTVASAYARLLAYKDEYEVARLLTHPNLTNEIKTNFASGGRLSFNLAPPILGGKAANGRPRKRAFAAWYMGPLLGTLARLRWMRGTPLDMFGLASERRAERQLIRDYERLIEDILRSLTIENHADAVRLAALVDMVRGFGPVKAEAMSAYYRRVVAEQRHFVTAPASIAAAQ